MRWFQTRELLPVLFINFRNGTVKGRVGKVVGDSDEGSKWSARATDYYSDEARGYRSGWLAFDVT